MKITEMYEAKMGEVAELKSAVENGDAEAAEKLAGVMDEAKELRAHMDEADAADEMLKSLGGIDTMTITDTEVPAKSLGEFAVKHLDVESVKSGAAKSTATDYGFKAATDLHTVSQIVSYDNNIVDPQRELSVRDLFSAESISGNALTYYVLGTAEGEPAVTAEGAKKPQIHIPYTPKTEALAKIAAYFKESDELLSDMPFMESALNSRGVYMHGLAVEDYLTTKLLATSGIHTETNADVDTLLEVAMGIREEIGYAADAIVINPADYAKLRVAKDSNLQYYGGGYFYGAYGNGTVTEQPGIWGMRTVVTPAVTAGTAIVGAFKQGGSVVTKSGEGLRVEVSDSNEDDFVKNAVTVRIEERMVLAVRVPAAFAKITFTS
ncbi:MAG: phage major capsid protein [Eggerthellaceae bacterium]|nr:phage major capsid protein [Eggerthellaceae bacterium]